MSLGVHLFPLAEMRRHDAEGEAFLREAFRELARAFERRGLQPHVEPEDALVPWPPPNVLANMPYSVFEQLGHAWVDLWPDLARDRFAGRVLALVDLRSHLLAHAGTEGFYLPIDFALPVYAEGDERALPGGLVGSSVKLLEELALLRAPLGVHDDPRDDHDDPLRSGWHTLHAAASMSVVHLTAIWFQ